MTAPAERPLTPKQLRFVAEYLVDLNATGAAERAEYKQAHSQGPRLLKQPNIAAAIAAAQAARAQRLEISADRVTLELARLALSDIRGVARWRSGLLSAAQALDPKRVGERGLLNAVDFIDSEQLSDDAAAAISEVSVDAKGCLKIKLHDKTAALGQLAKVLGMAPDKHEHSGPDGGPIEHAFVDRPPNETREEWLARRARELANVGAAAGTAD